MDEPENMSNPQLQATISELINEKTSIITRESDSINVKTEAVKMKKAFRQALNTLGLDRRTMLIIFEKLTEETNHD
jgi:hypothetical protein